MIENLEKNELKFICYVRISTRQNLIIRGFFMECVNFEPNFKITEIRLALSSISVYRNLLKDEVINSLYLLLDYIGEERIELNRVSLLYNDFFFRLSKSGADSLEEYIVDKIVFDENSFSRREKFKNQYGAGKFIEKAASNDLRNLQFVARFDNRIIKDQFIELFGDKYKQIIESFPDWYSDERKSCNESVEYVRSIKEMFYKSEDWRECLKPLERFHEKYGYSIFARYRAFVWEHKDGHGILKGISNPDPIQLSDLIGYEDKRSIVIENTLQFLNGFAANNVLLHGDRGTGKSSTVKAILNKYYTEGLRMIELPKAYITDFPDIIRILRNKPQKFIIFIDDLVFGDDEESYTALKSVLEGGLERKSQNILIYATSNRRHLVKEYFSDRSESQYLNNSEEIHAGDSRQEKLSLADRFGINIVFSSPDKKGYLAIVDGIADKRNLNIDREVLHREAMKWEKWYNGLSPRTAVQFVDWMEGHQSICSLETE